jgi:hypothetical protein
MARKRAHKPSKREAFNVESMSEIIAQAQAYLDGRIHISGACFNIHALVQRIVGEHVK